MILTELLMKEESENQDLDISSSTFNLAAYFLNIFMIAYMAIETLVLFSYQQVDKMLVYSILCATKQANLRRNLYSHSTELPPVTRLCTVVKLVFCRTRAECP